MPPNICQHLDDIHVHRAGVHAAPTPRTGHFAVKSILLWIIVELAHKAITQALAFLSAWFVSSRDPTIILSCAAIPATDPFELAGSEKRFIPHSKAPASRAHVRANAAAKAALGHASPILVIEMSRPGFFYDLTNGFVKLRL